MRFSKIFLFTSILLASNATLAVTGMPMTEDRRQPVLAHGAAAAPAYDIPLIDWSVPQFLGGPSGVMSSMGSDLAATGKSPTLKLDLGMSVFTPVQPCRLVDTRGLFSPVYAGGPFAAGEIRTYRAAGHCGLPVGSNRIKAISIAITTLPSSISGDVETVPHGTTLGGTVDMVVQANEWNSVSKIVRVDANGDFDMQLRFTSGDLAIDMNGYYADVNDSNNDTYSVIGTYTVDGGLFYSENKSATGAAVRAFNSAVGPGGGDVHLAQGRNAIDIADGQIRVRNAGVGTSTPVFIHQVGAANLCTTDARYTRLNETHLSPPNSSANQMLFVQEATHTGAAVTTTPKLIRTVFLSSFNCTGTPLLDSWYLFSDTAFASGETYNVLLINP
jgi:hypothetical protein